jgi:glucose-6-phosphate 1-epimerase
MSAAQSEGVIRLRELGASNGHASTAEVSLYAAHVTSWKVEGVEQLFMSSKAVVDKPGTAIRGGIPICWPQFGTFTNAAQAPGSKHGFLRQSDRWTVHEKRENEVVLMWQPDDAAKAKWAPESYAVLYTVALSGKELRLRLEVMNMGSEPLEFTCCLHTYFRVAAAETCAVSGLKGSRRDTGIGSTFRGDTVEAEEEVPFKGETELMFGESGDVVYLMEAGKPKLRLAKSAYPDWVLWNIGDKASSLADLGEGEEQHYVCVEPAVATAPARVLPGQAWCGVHEVRAM